MAFIDDRDDYGEIERLRQQVDDLARVVAQLIAATFGPKAQQVIHSYDADLAWKEELADEGTGEEWVYGEWTMTGHHLTPAVPAGVGDA